jgi:hypothetical protein
MKCVTPVLALMLLTTCGGDRIQFAGSSPLCNCDQDCPGGLCDRRVNPGLCTVRCTSVSECRSCAHSPWGTVCDRRSCANVHLNRWVVDADGNVCDNRVYVACELDETGCGCTGCAADEYCDRKTRQCTRFKDAGAPCSADRECSFSADVCVAFGGTQQKRCSVDRGAPCTPDTCQYCLQLGNETACSTECPYVQDIEICPEGFGCEDRFDDRVYMCLPTCDSKPCPPGWVCMDSPNAPYWYCM